MNLARKIISLRKRVFLFVNGLGSSKQCYICGKTFHHFKKYRGGTKMLSSWDRGLDIIGSDLDNFGCNFCGSHDRDRHLFMYFDKLKLWDKLKNSSVIHFAPEWRISKKIEELLPSRYVMADLYPSMPSIEKIDLTNIPYTENSFDVFICNHVLEHVPDYLKALKEIHRVLKKDGFAILQTPYSKLLAKNFQDDGINTNELRLIYYGQEDHIRHFSEKVFLKSIEDVGFELQIVKHAELFDKQSANYYGVNEREDLIRVVKL